MAAKCLQYIMYWLSCFMTVQCNLYENDMSCMGLCTSPWMGYGICGLIGVWQILETGEHNKSGNTNDEISKSIFSKTDTVHEQRYMWSNLFENAPYISRPFVSKFRYISGDMHTVCRYLFREDPRDLCAHFLKDFFICTDAIVWLTREGDAWGVDIHNGTNLCFIRLFRNTTLCCIIPSL